MQVAMNLQFCCVTSCTKKVAYCNIQRHANFSMGFRCFDSCEKSSASEYLVGFNLGANCLASYNLEAGCPGLIVRACGVNCLDSATLVTICDRHFLGVRNLFHSI